MIKPVGDKVLVRILEDDSVKEELGFNFAGEEIILPGGTKTESGLFLPAGNYGVDTNNKLRKGQIVAIGNGKQSPLGYTIPIEVEVGDIVLLTKESGTKVKTDGEEMVLVEEFHIITKVMEE